MLRRLLLALVVFTPAFAQQPKPNNAQDVLDLAKEVAAGNDVAAKAATLSKRFKTVEIGMRLYNPRGRGGIGFGPKGMAIERKLIDVGEKGISAETLKKEADELIRVAHVNLVLAEVTRGFAPAKPFLGRGKKEWERDVDAVRTASKELVKAVEASDPKAVQAAATRINNACNSCHDGAR